MERRDHCQELDGAVAAMSDVERSLFVFLSAALQITRLRDAVNQSAQKSHETTNPSRMLNMQLLSSSLRYCTFCLTVWDTHVDMQLTHTEEQCCSLFFGGGGGAVCTLIKLLLCLSELYWSLCFLSPSFHFGLRPLFEPLLLCSFSSPTVNFPDIMGKDCLSATPPTVLMSILYIFISL